MTNDEDQPSGDVSQATDNAMLENQPGGASGLESEPFTNKELRYLIFAALSELHRQRELLAYIASELGDDNKVEQLLELQQQHKYPIADFDWV